MVPYLRQVYVDLRCWSRAFRPVYRYGVCEAPEIRYLDWLLPYNRGVGGTAPVGLAEFRVQLRLAAGLTSACCSSEQEFILRSGEL